MNLPCAAQVFLNIPRAQLYGTFGIYSFLAAVVLGPMVLYFYRQRVLRLMAGPANAGDAVMETSGLSRADEPDRSRDFPGIEVLKLASGARATRLARSLRIVAIIFALVTVALSLALRWQAASSGPGTRPEVSVEDAIVVMPVRELDEQGRSGYVWLLGIVGGMCLGLIPRHMRNVVPILTLCLSLAAIVWVETNTLAGIYSTCVGWTPHTREEALRTLWIPGGLWALMLATGIFGIYGLLRAVTSAYRNKRFSDAQLQVLFWYMAVAFPVAGAIFASQIYPNWRWMRRGRMRRRSRWS